MHRFTSHKNRENLPLPRGLLCFSIDRPHLTVGEGGSNELSRFETIGLKAWVFDRGRREREREKGRNGALSLLDSKIVGEERDLGVSRVIIRGRIISDMRVCSLKIIKRREGNLVGTELGCSSKKNKEKKPYFSSEEKKRELEKK